MNRAELIALAERVEGLERPDRKIDVEVALAADWSIRSAPCPLRELANIATLDEIANDADSHHSILNQIPRYTASIDAAMTLVPDGYSHCYIDRRATIQGCKVNAQCWTSKIVSTLNGDAATPALALTAAALRAIASGCEE